MKTKRAYNIVPFSTSMESRLNEALSPHSVAVDDKNIGDHLTFISEYAKYINYYNLNDEKSGNWHSFFTDNDVVFLSRLLKTDVQELHKRKNTIYDKCVSPVYRHLKEVHIEALHLYFAELVALINSWFLQARNIQLESFVYELENAVKNRLAGEIKFVVAKERTSVNNTEVRETLYTIFSNWQQYLGGVSESIDKDSFYVTDDPDKLGNACNAFLNTIVYIYKRVPEWLQQALNQEEHHTSHIGLLLAFLDLHEHVKKQFNDISKRHLDHYYRDLLQQSEFPKKPDQCVVFFELAKEAPYCILEKGTRLSAGQSEDGKEIIYSTVEEEELSRSKIVEARTLFVSTNDIIAPLNKANLVTGIYTFHKNITEKELLNQEAYDFHLFGTDSFGNLNASQEDAKQPDIGWAIAAPVLFMKEGKRSVSLSVAFEADSMKLLFDHVKAMVHEGTDKEFNALLYIETLYHFFSGTFDLKITGQEGWISIENYAFEFDVMSENNYKFLFLFSFGREAPEITAFKPEVHQLHYNTEFPVLQMALKSNTTYYPYALLKDLVLSEMVINVECEGIKDVQLYNIYGKIDTNKPFDILGQTPLKGDSFYLGYEEFSGKTLNSLSLDINWGRLPEEGFKTHYEGYPGAIDNDSFSFNISALSQGEWTPKEEYQQNIKIFHQENNVLQDSSNYVVDTEKTWYASEFRKRALPFSLEHATNGFFKFELETPSIGFGYEAYLKLMNNTVYENITARNSRRRKIFTNPESPFVPKARSVRMHYSAEQVINFNTTEENRKAADTPFDFFHLQPFGILKIGTTKYMKENSLVPKFSSRGYLYLGINDVSPNQLISLYFRITTETDTSKEVDIGHIEWEYLLGTLWMPVKKEQIVEDDTVGFTNSGIIKIIVPGNIEQHHVLFSGAAFWLRISAPNSLDIVRNCTYINTRAVLVEKNLAFEDTVSEAPLPAETISAIYDKNKDVKSVFQPFPSYGGHIAEATEDFYNRVSERLYHKHRAITTDDYERLVLQEFPEIFQVSCLTSTLFPKDIKSNEVVLMILRNMQVNDRAFHRMFNVTTLERVKQYVAKLCAPEVKITVRNPVFETIRISCHVKLKDNRLSGEKLKKLQKAINAHIAPWLYHKDRQTEYRKHILHAKGIKNLISRQPYVEFVTNFSLVQFNRQSSKYTYRDTAVGTSISPSEPWSVFVPAPAHTISLMNEHEIQPATPLKIGVMQIEDDFILQPEESPEAPEEVVVEEKNDNRDRMVLRVRF